MTIPILAAIFWMLWHPASSIAQNPPTTWTEFDHKDMVLLDISPGPASYVAAFVAGPNGEVTGDLANMRRVRISPIDTQIAAVKSNQFVPTETFLDKAILMNDSEQAVIVYVQTDAALLELNIPPGEGLVIGDMPRHGTTIFGEGCRCICDLGGGLHREAIIMCDSILADLPPESACDCNLIHGDDCMAYNKRGELSDGRIKAGKKIWYPRPTSTGKTDNGNTNAASDADPGRGD
jgi:hypothetical protein